MTSIYIIPKDVIDSLQSTVFDNDNFTGRFLRNWLTFIHIALDKREYLVIIRDNFCEFCIKTYVVNPSSDEMVQMRDHNIMVLMRNKKNYHQLLS